MSWLRKRGGREELEQSAGLSASGSGEGISGRWRAGLTLRGKPGGPLDAPTCGWVGLGAGGGEQQ